MHGLAASSPKLSQVGPKVAETDLTARQSVLGGKKCFATLRIVMIAFCLERPYIHNQHCHHTYRNHRCHHYHRHRHRHHHHQDITIVAIIIVLTSIIIVVITTIVIVIIDIIAIAIVFTSGNGAVISIRCIQSASTACIALIFAQGMRLMAAYMDPIMAAWDAQTAWITLHSNQIREGSKKVLADRAVACKKTVDGSVPVETCRVAANFLIRALVVQHRFRYRRKGCACKPYYTFHADRISIACAYCESDKVIGTRHPNTCL